MINRPAQVGRVLSDRLSPTTEKPFKIIGHPFLEVRSTDLQEIAASKTVAYERESANARGVWRDHVLPFLLDASTAVPEGW